MVDDRNGISDLMVKFGRENVQDTLNVGSQTVAGEVSGVPFAESDTIEVI